MNEKELTEIVDYIKQSHISDSIHDMEMSLDLANGYSQRIGELLNEAVWDYETMYSEALNKLMDNDSETETTRKAKLNGWLADKKKWVSDLKVANNSLRAIRMSLMQSIKTRREEPR